MAQVLVRNLDDDVKTALQQRARRHGHSMEEEIRTILRQALVDEGASPSRLGSRIAARFAGQGLTEDLPELRGQKPQPALFEP
jgi:antitoxin FitA